MHFYLACILGIFGGLAGIMAKQISEGDKSIIGKIIFAVNFPNAYYLTLGANIFFVAYFNVMGLKYGLESFKINGTSATVGFSFQLNQITSSIYEGVYSGIYPNKGQMFGQLLILIGVTLLRKLTPENNAIDKKQQEENSDQIKKKSA